MNGLRIAVPRGALFADTLDLLDRLGIDTGEVRENDRKLLFESCGIVTMRPSDVPTYVEAGAADLGITGKDVLMEQSEREVYELVDLGFGRCRMVLAGVAGDDRAAEALRRLGVVRIATKYPRIAARHFLRDRTPGRDRRGQGLSRARAADRTGRGDRRPHRDRNHAARERPGGPRGDRGLHGPPDRQPRRPQAAARRRSTVWWSASVQCERITLSGDATALAEELRGLVPAPDSVQERCRRSSPACAPAATTRCVTTPASSTPAARRRRRCGCPTPSSTPPPSAWTPRCGPA